MIVPSRCFLSRPPLKLSANADRHSYRAECDCFPPWRRQPRPWWPPRQRYFSGTETRAFRLPLRVGTCRELQDRLESAEQRLAARTEPAVSALGRFLKPTLSRPPPCRLTMSARSRWTQAHACVC